MIILDTHIWIWWVHDETYLTQKQLNAIGAHENNIIGVSSISLWEVAKLVEYKRLDLPCTLEEWFSLALDYPGISVIELNPEIVIESTRLPGEFHRDPADQLIVATARIFSCPLLTSDTKILNYPSVSTLK